MNSNIRGVEILNIKKITAVVATDDILAFGVNLYLTQKNIRDIAVVGFNNSPLAEYQRPPLTSVDINAQKIGYYTAKLLIDKLENNIKETYYIIETSLIERESTGNLSGNNCNSSQC
mgnify:CR=1 FL=1